MSAAQVLAAGVGHDFYRRQGNEVVRHHEADPDSAFPKYFSGGVVVTTRDGRELVHMEKINRGAGERALSADDITEKFFDKATLVISKPQAERIRKAVLDMDRHDARDLARTLALN